GRLHINPPRPGEAAASYMHFPADRDLNYFSQLLAERSVLKESGGQRFRVWEQLPGRANEALDCRVYGYAALCGLLHMGLKLNALDSVVIRYLTKEQDSGSEQRQEMRHYF
ncbi:terminase gpA endonuclease subunit, partial [Photorhabdus sp. RM105S]